MSSCLAQFFTIFSALDVMLHVDWTSLFKTVGLCKARIARSLKHERLVPVEPEENPMPEGSVMGHENADEYLRSVHETHMNNVDPDLYVIHYTLKPMLKDLSNPWIQRLLQLVPDLLKFHLLKT